LIHFVHSTIAHHVIIRLLAAYPHQIGELIAFNVSLIFCPSIPQISRVGQVLIREHLFVSFTQSTRQISPSSACRTPRTVISSGLRIRRYPPLAPRIDWIRPVPRRGMTTRLNYSSEMLSLGNVFQKDRILTVMAGQIRHYPHAAS